MIIFPAIVGDIMGLPFEGQPPKITKDFRVPKSLDRIKKNEYLNRLPLFKYSDDSILTLAGVEYFLNGCQGPEYYAAILRAYYADYPNGRYGGKFHEWANNLEMGPYQSWGNGGLMRTGFVPFLEPDPEKGLALALEMNNVTHDHPISQDALTLMINFLYEIKSSTNKKNVIKKMVLSLGLYDQSGKLPKHQCYFDNIGWDNLNAINTMQFVALALVNSRDFYHVMERGIQIGGDTDTVCSIAANFAYFLHGIPMELQIWAESKLSVHLRQVNKRAA